MTKAETKVVYFFSLLLASVLAASFLSVRLADAQAEPGIRVTQAAGPATVGQPFTLTIEVTNGSASQLVGLKDFLPPEMTFVSATPSQGTCGMGHHDHNTVECTLGELPTGGSATVDIVATPTAPGDATNTAVGQGEVAPASTDTATIPVNQAPE